LEFQSIDGFHDGHDVIGLYPLLSPKACWLVSLMSALGQKRTYAVQQVMSALAPIATAKADFSQKVHVRFTPESGHVRRKPSCLLWAKSGHREDY
jgi:hypothetical protein